MSPTLTQQEALEHLRAALVPLTGLTGDDVLFGFDAAAEPTTPYLWVRTMRSQGVGMGGWVDAAKTRWQQAQQVVVQVSAHGSVAVVQALISAVAQLRSRSAACLALTAAGVAVQEIGSVQDTTALLGPRHQLRAVCLLTLGYVLEVATTPGAVPATALHLEVAATGDDEIPSTLVYTESLP